MSESPALVTARAELAHAEQERATAQATIDRAPAVDAASLRQARAALSYYAQQADRYRTQVARLLREQQHDAPDQAVS